MIDLHIHTTASDGQYSPTELIQKAASKKITTLAITDHDTVAGLEEGKLAAKQEGINFVPGVELNIQHFGGEFHLLGLGFTSISDSLKEVLTDLQKNRENRNILMVEKIKGNNIYYEGFGTLLFSKFDSEESCYLKAYGKTKGFVIAERIEKEQREAQETARANAKIPQLIERGLPLIYPQKEKKWREWVERSVKGLYRGRDVEEALDVMEKLNKGVPYDKTNEIIVQSGHTGGSYSCVMGAIVNFSKDGPAFFRHVSPKPLPYDTQENLQKIERENDYYKMLERETAKAAKTPTDGQTL